MNALTPTPSVAPEVPAGLAFLRSGSFRFSLDGVPERERVPMFREQFGSVIRYDIEPLPDARFDVDVKLKALPGLMMMWGRSHGSRNRRTRETLEVDATDDIGMILNVRGPLTIDQHGRELVLGDGEAAIVSLGEIACFTHRPPGDIVALRVPRKQFAPLVTAVDECYGQRIPAETPALRLLSDYLKLAQDGEDAARPELQHLVVGHIYDLMAIAAGATRDAAESAQGRGLRAARLHAIKKDIAGNLDRADLSVAALAVRHGCTPRFIQRLFEAEGTTLTEYVLTQRLARAHRMLIDLRRAGDKISTIALDASFADVSYFNRAFRQLYGDTPSAVRAQMHQHASGNTAH